MLLILTVRKLIRMEVIGNFEIHVFSEKSFSFLHFPAIFNVLVILNSSKTWESKLKSPLLLPLASPPSPTKHTHTHTNTHTQTHIQTHTHTHTHTHTRIAILLPHKDCKFYETFRKYSTCKFSGTFSFRFPPKGRHHYKYQRSFSKHLFL